MLQKRDKSIAMDTVVIGEEEGTEKAEYSLEDINLLIDNSNIALPQTNVQFWAGSKLQPNFKGFNKKRTVESEWQNAVYNGGIF